MRARLGFLSLLASASAVSACGARTGLDAPVVVALPPSCDDAGVTFIYVVTEHGALVSYYPPTGEFTTIGTLACPLLTPGAAPYSMAVDRRGTAYVVFDDGNLYKVSTADASCLATSFVVGQQGFVTFGPAFVADSDDPGETLFAAEEGNAGPSLGLATIDVSTFELSFIGPFSPMLGPPELTGTGDGRLFGYSGDEPGTGSQASQVDKATASVTSSESFGFGGSNDAYAWAFWGGSFYIFDTPPGATASTVRRYQPGNPVIAVVSVYPDTIVGAGVSTCAPH